MSEQQPAAQETPEAAPEQKPTDQTPPEAAQVENGDKGKDGGDKETEKAAKPEEKAVPEKYELKLPEDSLLDAGKLEKISQEAKEKGLSNDEAQALLEREHAAVSEFFKSQEAKFAEKIEAWKSEAASDKDMGGEKFKENIELAHRVIERFAPEGLKDDLDKSMFGMHPGLLKTFWKIGQAMKEDTTIHPGAQSNADAQTHEAILYPSMNGN